MKVLIVDDEPSIRTSLGRLLAGSGWETREAADGLEARACLESERFDLVVADLRMPRMDGMALLQWAQEDGPDVPFVMISAHGEIKDAVEAMKAGARDYLCKPFDPDELELRLLAALEAERNGKLLRADRTRITSSPAREAPRPRPMSAMARVEAVLEKAAPGPSLILITGESGTGKEVLARRIHERSPWSAGPFVAVNVGGLPEALLESELFGYEKGAFTGADRRKTGMFEVAAGGTIFLDEIGDMPMTLQVKLLRVLQERKIQRLGGTVPIPVEARILAATHRDLQAEVKAGRFREDLYYRLNVVPVHLPPLRERKEDLPDLVGALLEKIATQLGRPVPRPTAETMALLASYAFPGNIRELENLLERAIIFSTGPVIEPEDIDIPHLQRRDVGPGDPGPASLWSIERAAILAALERHGGNRSAAARELGISRRTLFNKLQDYGMESGSAD